MFLVVASTPTAELRCRADSVLCTPYRYPTASHRLPHLDLHHNSHHRQSTIYQSQHQHSSSLYTTNTVAELQRPHFIMLAETPKSLKRSYQRMIHDQAHGMMNMENVSYHDFQPGAFYTPPPPPPQQVLFSNPFPSPNEYVTDGYLPSAESMGYFPTHRSLSESFVHNPSDSFGSMSSGSSSCNVSIGPATPPPAPHHFGPTKFPAVPITPSHVVPRQKAKRTATVCLW